MSTPNKHLVHLSQLKDYKVDHHDHDIRGWKLLDRNKRTIGKVDNLLVNQDLGKVVYVDVQVEQGIIDKNHDPYSGSQQTEFKEFINKEGENHIIIPIGLIDINAEEKYVYTEGIDYQTFAETKRYRSGSDISRNYEHHVLGSYNRDYDYNTKYSSHTSRADNADHAGTYDERDRGFEKLSEDEKRMEREREQMQYSSNERRGSINDTPDSTVNTNRHREDNLRDHDNHDNYENNRRAASNDDINSEVNRDREDRFANDDNYGTGHKDSRVDENDSRLTSNRHPDDKFIDDDNYDTGRRDSLNDNRDSGLTSNRHREDHLTNDDDFNPDSYSNPDSQDNKYAGRSANKDSKRPVDDHHRSQDYHEKNSGFKPEKSIDEDQQWQRDERELDDSKDFYNRREFNKRR